MEINEDSSSSTDHNAEIVENLMSPQEKYRRGLSDPSSVCGICFGTDGVDYEHPFIVAGLCVTCKDVLLATTYATDSSGRHVYCTVCCRLQTDEKQGGVQIDYRACEESSCWRLFCRDCVESLSGRPLMDGGSRLGRRKRFKWLCFLCRDGDARYGSLRFHRDFLLKLMELHEPSSYLSRRALSWRPEPLRVLSLFDGIGTGLYVLQQLGINVELYVASEVLPEAILVAKSRLGDKICHVGSVGEVTGEVVREIAPIHLLVGGSPCNDLSGINRRPRDFFDPDGTAKFFFDYFRVKRLVEDCNGDNRHLLWLFENVATMPRYFRETISKFLQSEPVVLNAKHFSPQNRLRYFWGNIPGMRTALDPDALRPPATLDEALIPGSGRAAAVNKVKTVTTQYNSLLQGRPSTTKKGSPAKSLYPVRVKVNNVDPNAKEEVEVDVLWLPEIEEVFGFPRHFTDVGNLSRGQRQKLLGHSWPVQLIAHILKPLKDYTV